MTADRPGSRRQALRSLTLGGLLLGGLLPRRASASPPIGQPAPDFTLPDLKGAAVRLRDLRGKVVLIDFWASWCEPCMKELPELEKLHRKLATTAPLVVVGVNLDEQRANAQAVVSRLGLSFPILLDAQRTVAELYDPPKMPATYLVDRSGVLRYLNPGFTGAGDLRRLDQQLGELLK
jgi:peroxiredoxin